MPRRQRPMPKPKPVVRTYNVLNKNARHLGGAKVQVNGDQRTVQMSENEARYWIDQGVLQSQEEVEVDTGNF